MVQSTTGASPTFVLPRESLAHDAHHGAAALSAAQLAALLFDAVQLITDVVQAQAVAAQSQPLTRATEIGEHLPNLTDNTSISERRIMTQTMAHLLLLVVSSYSAGLVRYRRFGRPCHCFDTMLHV